MAELHVVGAVGRASGLGLVALERQVSQARVSGGAGERGCDQRKVPARFWRL